jgi:hypothetical protein
MSEQQQTLTIQQAIDLAVQHHNVGRLPEAESIYQQGYENYRVFPLEYNNTILIIIFISSQWLRGFFSVKLKSKNQFN